MTQVLIRTNEVAMCNRLIADTKSRGTYSRNLWYTYITYTVKLYGSYTQLKWHTRPIPTKGHNLISPQYPEEKPLSQKTLLSLPLGNFSGQVLLY